MVLLVLNALLGARVGLGLSRAYLLAIWLAIELGSLSFLGQTLLLKKRLRAEGAIVYYFIQSLGSIILLFSLFKGGLAITALSVYIKLGVWPFHNWFLKVSELVNWWGFIVLSSLLKVLPFYILYLHPRSSFERVGAANLIVGLLLAWGKFRAKGLLACSGLHHIGAMLLINRFWLAYIALYFLILGLFCLIGYLIDLKALGRGGRFEFIFILGLFSLAGLPPLAGFNLKLWLISACLGSSPVLILIIARYWISLFVYTRLIWANLIVSRKGSLNKGLLLCFIGLNLRVRLRLFIWV